jgi:hypothetical protein
MDLHYLFSKLAFEWGYGHAHWGELLEKLFARFPDRSVITVLFSRYATLYSCEHQMFLGAVLRLKALKHNNIEIKHVLFGPQALLHQRASHLSAPIQKAMKRVQKEAERIRSQLHLFWKGVICGEVTELENLAVDLCEQQDDIMQEYQHLCFVYQNNPHIRRSYAVFLAEILNNEEKAEEMRQEERKLLSESYHKSESFYLLAKELFDALPTQNTKHSSDAFHNYVPQVCSK